MIVIIDTAIWIDHIARADDDVNALLDLDRVAIHPYIIGEVMLGNFRNRKRIRDTLEDLPGILPVRHVVVMTLVEQEGLHGTGIGYVDLHLLASARVIQNAKLWTRDKRLARAAEQLGVEFAA